MLNRYGFVFILCLFLCAFVPKLTSAQCGVCELPGTNVVVNGDFAVPSNLTFTSQYNYSLLLNTPGNYFIARNANNFNSSFQGIDHTNGLGNFLMVNGNNTSGTNAWCQTVSVAQNTSYTFGAWFASLSSNNPGQIQVQINGGNVGASFLCPAAVNNWVNHTESWQSGTNTFAQICLVNSSTASSGNDFGIDDISFVSCTPIERDGSGTDLGPDQYFCSTASTDVFPQDTVLGGVIPNQYQDSTGTVYYENNSDSVVTFALVATGNGAFAGCINADTLKITVYPPLNPDFGPDRRVCNTPVTLTNTVTNDSIRWSTGETTQSITVTKSGTYWGTVYRWSCSETDTVNVIIDTVPTFTLPPLIELCTAQDTVIRSPFIAPWSTGVTANNITVNSAGTYFQTVTNGSCTYSDTTLVTMSTYPTVNLGPDRLSCDGTPIALTSPGIGIWQDGSSSVSYTGLTGTYWKTVTNGPCATTDTAKIVVRNVVPQNVPAVNDLCTPAPFTLSFGYSGTPTFLWSTGATTPTLTVNTSGTYWVEIRDTTCFASDTMVVTYRPVPVVSLPAAEKICQGNTVTLTSPSSPGETYSWSNGNTTNSITTGTAGTYTLTADNGYCTASDATVVTVLSVSLPTWSSDTAICETDSLKLSAVVSPEYSYLWSTGATSSSITVKNPATYQLIVTNDICLDSVKTNLTTDQAVVFSLPPTAKICQGDSVLLSTTLVPSYTYLWNNGANTTSIYAKTAGNKILTVTNGACSAKDTTLVNVLSVSLPNWPTDTVICQSDSLKLSAVVLPGYSYLWSTGATSSSITVKNPATYKLTVTNDICLDSVKINLTTDQTVALNLAPTAKICQGDSVLLATTVVSGYMYLWNNGATTASIYAKTAGNKILTVTNGACSAKDTTVVSIVTMPGVALPNSVSICPTDSATLTVGAVTGYTYLWSTGETSNSIITKTPGTYTVNVTNDICTSTGQTTLNNLPAPTSILPSAIVICSGIPETVTANSDAGTSVLWSTGATTNSISISSLGTYRVTLTKGTCSIVDSIIATSDVSTVLSLNDTSKVCTGQVTTIGTAPLPGYSYLWSSGETTSSITTGLAGKYILTASNGGCSGTDSTIVIEVSVPTAALPASGVFCEKDSLILIGSTVSGHTNTWSNGATSSTLAVKQPGTYSLTVANDICTATASTTILMDSLPVSLLPDSIVYCGGASRLVTATTNPLVSALWNTGETTAQIAISSSGVFSVELTRGVCTTTASLVADVSTLPILNLPDSILNCHRDTSQLVYNSVPGFIHTWNSVSTVNYLFPDSSGLYKLNVVNTTDSLCATSDSSYVTVIPVPVLNFPAAVSLCLNDSLVLYGTTMPTYSNSWSTGETDSLIVVKQGGLFKLTVASTYCIDSAQTLVTINPTPTSTLPEAVVLCNGSAQLLTATNTSGTSVSWNTGENTNSITVSTPGYYVATIDNGLCSITDSTLVSDDLTAVITLPDTTRACSNAPAIIFVTELAGFNYSWNNGETTSSISTTTSGLYEVTVSNTNCTTTASTTLVIENSPNPVLAAELTLCEGDSVTLVGSQVLGQTNLWSTGASSNSITVEEAGMYYLFITEGSCTTQDSIQILVTPGPALNISPAMNYCEGDSLILLGAVGVDFQNQWSDGSTASQFVIKTSGTYTLDVTNAGCNFHYETNVTEDKMPLGNLDDSVAFCANTTNQITATNSTFTSVLWSTGSTENTITVPFDGLYRVTVRNGACVISDSTWATITQSPLPELMDSIAFCEGTDTTITVVQIPGWAYNWSIGATAATVVINQPGLIVLTADNGSCFFIDSIIASSDPFPISALPDTYDICAGDNAILDPGTQNIQKYFWSNGQTTNTITVGDSASYTVRLENFYCVTLDTTRIILHHKPIVSLADSMRICSTDSAFVTLVTDSVYPVQWSNGSNGYTQVLVQPGTYSVEVINNGCIVTDSLVLRVDKQPNSALPNSARFCEGSQVKIHATDSSYQSVLWSTGETSNEISVNQEGWYNVDVVNGRCNFSDSVVVTMDSLPNPNLADTTKFCVGKSVLVSYSGKPGDLILWSNGSTAPNQSVSTAGYFSLRVTRGACVISDSTLMSSLSFPISNLEQEVVVCETDSVLLNPLADLSYSYLWSTGENTATIWAKLGGIYRVSVINEICITKDSANVQVLEIPVITKPESFIFCEGDTVTVDLGYNPKYIYDWNPGDTSVKQIWDAGTYPYKVSYGLCTLNDSVVATIDSLPVLNLSDTAICKNDSAVIVIAPSQFIADFLWSDGFVGGTHTLYNQGKYYLTVYNLNCSLTDSLVLTVHDRPTVTFPPDQAACMGDSVLLSVLSNPGYSYNWSDTTGLISTQFEIKRAGNSPTDIVDTVALVVSNAFGCSVSDTIYTTHYAMPTLDLGPGVDSCLTAIDSVPIAAIGTYQSLIWKGTRGNIIPVINDTMWVNYLTSDTLVFVTAFNNICFVHDTVPIYAKRFANDSMPATDTLCSGQSLVYDKTSKAEDFKIKYQWSDYSVQPGFTVNMPGTYWVDITLGECTKRDTFNVIGIPDPTYPLTADDTICVGDTLFLPPLPQQYTLDYISPNVVNDSMVMSAGVVELLFHNYCNSLAVKFEVFEENCGRSLYFPSAFTPDRNDLNEVFRAVYFNYDLVEITVVNRWGELVFYGKGKDPFWDGTFKGKAAKADVYKVYVTGSYLEGNQWSHNEQTGLVHLIR